MDPTALYYALSTIAQCAAALAAILGAFGLWRLDHLRELDRHEEEREPHIKQELLPLKVQREYEQEKTAMGTVMTEGERSSTSTAALTERMLELRLTRIDATRQFYKGEWSRFKNALVAVLFVILTILVLAIVGIPFVGTLHTWPWTLTILIIVASLGLGVGPAYMVWQAARSVGAVVMLALLALASPALAGPPVRCTTSEEQTLGRLHTRCDDGTRGIRRDHEILDRWDMRSTPRPSVLREQIRPQPKPPPR
jgi:hypothetical protein